MHINIYVYKSCVCVCVCVLAPTFMMLSTWFWGNARGGRPRIAHRFEDALVHLRHLPALDTHNVLAVGVKRCSQLHDPATTWGVCCVCDVVCDGVWDCVCVWGVCVCVCVCDGVYMCGVLLIWIEVLGCLKRCDKQTKKIKISNVDGGNVTTTIITTSQQTKKHQKNTNKQTNKQKSHTAATFTRSKTANFVWFVTARRLWSGLSWTTASTNVPSRTSTLYSLFSYQSRNMNLDDVRIWKWMDWLIDWKLDWWWGVGCALS